MKRLFVVCVALFCTLCLQAKDVKALLVVENHTKDIDPVSLDAIGDEFSAELSENGFEVIMPADNGQIPEASNLRLAELNEAEAVIVLSLTSVSVKSYGATAKALQVNWTARCLRVPDGEAVFSVTAPYTSPKEVTAMFKENFISIRDEAMLAAIKGTATKFIAASKRKPFTAGTIQMAKVYFISNVAGANVKIDGVSYGTAGTQELPLMVEASKKVHDIEISFPYKISFKTRARFTGVNTFAVNLVESLEGRQLRMGDKVFDTMIDRVVKSGATDDEVRVIEAKGYHNFLSASSVNIQGMPTNLSIVNNDHGAIAGTFVPAVPVPAVPVPAVPVLVK